MTARELTTAAQRRVLASIRDKAADGEALLHKPRRNLLRVGREGVSAHWKTFEELKTKGLIDIRPGFAASEYVSLTAEGRRVVGAGE